MKVYLFIQYYAQVPNQYILISSEQIICCQYSLALAYFNLAVLSHNSFFSQMPSAEVDCVMSVTLSRQSLKHPFPQIILGPSQGDFPVCFQCENWFSMSFFFSLTSPAPFVIGSMALPVLPNHCSNCVLASVQQYTGNLVIPFLWSLII